MRRLGLAIAVCLMFVAVEASALESVRTTASDGSYIDPSTQLVYNYNATFDIATPTGTLGQLTHFEKLVSAIPCGDHGVCVVVSASLQGEHSETWIVKPNNDLGNTPPCAGDDRTHGPFVSTSQTHVVTFVAGNSTDEFHCSGTATVLLIRDGFRQVDSATVSY